MKDNTKTGLKTGLKYTGAVVTGGVIAYLLFNPLPSCNRIKENHPPKKEISDTTKYYRPPKKIIKDKQDKQYDSNSDTIDNVVNDDKTKVIVITDNRNNNGLFGRKNKDACAYQCPTNEDLILFYSGTKGKKQGVWYENHNGNIRIVPIDAKRDNVYKWSTVSNITSLETFKTYFGENYVMNGTPKIKQMTDQEREFRNRQNYAPGYEPRSGFSQKYLKQKQQFKGRR